MAHNTTVFRQLLDLLPRHEFDAEARRHQKGQRLRVMSRWAQFVALGLGQLAGLQSLRDIVGSLRAQPHKLYHLGVRAFVSRSSLARVNTEQPYTLYETLFGRLLARCQQRAPRQQASGSRTSCSRWMRRPSTCAWRLSRGRRSGARKAQSSCTSAGPGGTSEVRPAAGLEPAPNVTGSSAQLVRPPSIGGAVHDALATGLPRPSDAAVVLKDVGQ